MIGLGFVLIIIIVFILIILSSTIEIKLKDFKFSTISKKKYNFILCIKIKFLNKITIFKKSVYKNKIDSKKIIKKIDRLKKKIPITSKNLNLENIKNLKKLKIEFKKVNLNVLIGIEDASLNAIIVGLISGVIGATFGLIGKKENDYIWDVKPLYKKNSLIIDISCIINIKLIHIIYTIYVLSKKGEKYGRTSNRRAYAYSNE